MVRINNRQLLGIIVMISAVFIFTLIPLSVLGWAPASTPQAYLPVMLKLSTPTPAITPTAEPTATLTPPQPPSDWLAYVNWLRSLGGLPALTENSEWSLGGEHHARYMVKNDIIGHSEDSNLPWYTEDGNDAAGSSNVMASSSASTTDISAIDMWMSGPFHGVGILDPALTETGFGSYREADGGIQMGACLDVIRGLGSIPPSVTFPILWPGDGRTMPYTSFNGGESPNPLTSCPGYAAPSGPPIYLQIGSGGQVPSVTAHTFQQAGSILEHCVFDETNYSNADSGSQSLGRSVLHMRNAIVLMPKKPLNPGVTYTVSITNSGTMYTWSFTVTGTQILPAPITEIQ
jgi:uncharacterized protein YkwD